MSRERRYVGLALLLALPMSQLGHVLAYALQRLPSSGGVHAYFPALLTAVAGSAAAALLAALLVVGAGRLLNPGWTRSGAAVAVGPPLAALFAGQLLVYLFQETLELAVLGREPSLQVLLWGVAGQAPVALLAALALRWLSQRLEPALSALGALHAVALLYAASDLTPLTPAAAPATTARTWRTGNHLRAPPPLPPG